MFALSSRRKAYSHFYCRNNNLVSFLHCCVWISAIQPYIWMNNVKLNLKDLSAKAPYLIHASFFSDSDLLLLSNRRWLAGCMAACTRTVLHGKNMIVSLLSPPVASINLLLYLILDDVCISITLHSCSLNFPVCMLWICPWELSFCHHTR